MGIMKLHEDVCFTPTPHSKTLELKLLKLLEKTEKKI